MRPYNLPETLGDERLDQVINIIHYFINSPEARSTVTLDWSRLKTVLPAGHAILALLADLKTTRGIRCKNLRVPMGIRGNPAYQILNETSVAAILPTPDQYKVEARQLLFRVINGTIDPTIADELLQRFSDIDEEVLFATTLILNELTQNAVDHGASERYYVYAGVHQDEMHVGVLDMGISIPGRMERKFPDQSDVELVILSLKEGVGTRTTRLGGFGLHIVHETAKSHQGRFVLVSRRAQIRKYFRTRRRLENALKHPLPGTFCMIRLPLTTGVRS